MGGAPAGSAPRGRVDLIGSTFELTPGEFVEGVNGRGGAAGAPGPVATIQFPCTVKALDPARPPVFRSVTATRDVVQVEAQWLPPLPGEVRLQDLVIRDNRADDDTGEAGLRLKDRLPGRSFTIERCTFIRCQNAIAGGGLGQRLSVHDCRIEDCGSGTQAHSLYVQPEWLEFAGNLVLHTPGWRGARAHMLKSRALVSRILGNCFLLPDSQASFMIDLSNGGDVEIGGNLLHYGVTSDNSSATLIAYAPEGAGGDMRRDGQFVFAPGRRFRLVARNNTLLSDYPGLTTFFMVDSHHARRFDGSEVDSYPAPLQIADNLLFAREPRRLLLRRDRAVPGMARDLGGEFPDNTWLESSRRPHTAGRDRARPNTDGTYVARRFTGNTAIGTGSAPYQFTSRGAAV